MITDLQGLALQVSLALPHGICSAGEASTLYSAHRCQANEPENALCLQAIFLY
jgi:hypothetical protein